MVPTQSVYSIFPPRPATYARVEVNWITESDRCLSYPALATCILYPFFLVLSVSSIHDRASGYPCQPQLLSSCYLVAIYSRP